MDAFHRVEVNLDNSNVKTSSKSLCFLFFFHAPQNTFFLVAPFTLPCQAATKVLDKIAKEKP